MSGHSKWSTIKHKKGAKDAKRGKAFSKIGRMIAVATQEGGGNPETNFKLRLAIEKGRQANMAQSTIKKAIARATGGGKESKIEETTYEATGSDRLAIIIKTATDNKNRTLAEIKYILSKNNARLADPGSLSWQFERKGILDLGAIKLSEDQELAIIEAGAQDIKKTEESLLVYTKPRDLQKVKETLDQAKIKAESAELGFVPKNPIKLEVSKVEPLLNALEEHNDVQGIYTNLELTS